MKNWLMGICCLLVVEYVHGQGSKPADVLFVHTDKHIYTNNEWVWFSAYVLRCDDSLVLHQFMSVLLVQAGTNACVLQQKFAMNAGSSSGSFQLPDSIAPGEYKLLAYTNVMGNDSLPLAAFTQPLSIRSMHSPDFIASLDLTEGAAGKKQLSVIVRDKATGTPIRDANLFLQIDKSQGVFATTDKDGRYRHQLPVFSDTSLPVINVRIKYHGSLAYLQKALPAQNAIRQLVVRFYPEGGYLLDQMPCRVGWESKTDKGEPLAVKIVLLKNNIPFDTIQTNELGLGDFMFVPDATAVYTISPLSLPAGLQLQNDVNPLPAVLRTGATMQLRAAVAGDSLRFRIYAREHAWVKMVVHDGSNIFATARVDTRNTSLPVLLLLNAIPKGLAVITLLDSLNRPLAERVFFAHYNQQAVLQVSPGSAVYEKREKVTVHFSLTNNGLSAPGQASVACAQANRFESSKQQDIESFCYLQAALHELPLYNKGRGYTDLPYLEQVMLVKGWRKFNQVVQDTLRPQSRGYYLPEISGTLVHARKKIKKPGTVTLMGNGFIGIVTDSSGHFDLSFRQLLVPQDRKLWMLAGERSTGEYHVEINDPFLAINRRMSAALHFPEIKGNKYIQYSQDLVVKGLASVNQLADVVVKARADRTIFGATSNECGDYVCSYNILNCPNHAGAIGSHAPVKGKQYRMPGGGTSIYWGCVFEEQQQGEAFLVYEGIKAGKTFYAEDFSATSNGMPEYISTLYWSPKLVFDNEGRAECSFYTGDIDGYFRIVVNGITAGNAFFATASFQVK